MIDIYKKSELTALLSRHKFTMSKSLGQNFLTDRNIIEKIADALDITEDDLVVEIGPGVGSLTKELSEGASLVKSVEIDRKLLPLLDEVLRDSPNTQIINEDFMKVNLSELVEGRAYKLIGNLPYYITTPIIMKVLEEGPKPESMVFMIQKEVAQRLSAKPGTKDYGTITVAAGYYCKIEYLFTVSREVFLPKPNVDSAVIRMTPYKDLPVKVEDSNILSKVIKAGFGQRRKTLSNSLKQVDGLSGDDVKLALKRSEIDPRRRAETLDISEFARLSDTVTLLLRNKV
jgi:16S rRNA (adenine1518-N6/adenine1519-N6)-dimethyltransferase